MSDTIINVTDLYQRKCISVITHLVSIKDNNFELAHRMVCPFMFPVHHSLELDVAFYMYYCFVIRNYYNDDTLKYLNNMSKYKCNFGSIDCLNKSSRSYDNLYNKYVMTYIEKFIIANNIL